MEKAENPLVQQIKGNLNWPSVAGIIRGGPSRWRHVISQVRTHMNPGERQKVALYKEKKIIDVIKHAGLKPVIISSEYAGTPILNIGCELPATAGYSLLVPSHLYGEVPVITDHLTSGIYLMLPAPTTDSNLMWSRFNNGFLLMGGEGNVVKTSSKIEPFKGSIGIAFRDSVSTRGQVSLFSPEQTQDLIANPVLARRQFPYGGPLLGLPLYTELGEPDEPLMKKAIRAILQSRYFGTYNSDFSCYIQVGQKLFTFNNLLHEVPNEACMANIGNILKEMGVNDEQIEEEWYQRKSNVARLLLGTYAALYSASKVTQPGIVAKVVLAEQNYSGFMKLEKLAKGQSYGSLEPHITLKLK